MKIKFEEIQDALNDEPDITGFYDPDDDSITINPKFSMRLQRETLIHEVLERHLHKEKNNLATEIAEALDVLSKHY